MIIDSVCNLIAAFFFISSCIILCRWRRRLRLPNAEFVPLLLSLCFYAFVVFSNLLEHLKITDIFDPAEDMAEILFCLVFLFFVNNWRSRRTIEDIQEEETWQRVTLESMADGVMTTDCNGHILQMNKVMETLTGRSAADAIGKSAFGVLSFIDKKTGQAVVYDPYDEVVRQGKEHTRGEGLCLLQRGTAKKIPISEHTAAIRTGDNRLLGAVGVFRDMSENEHLVEQLTHVHKMEAVGQLAGGVAHDLNNMLGGIMGAADLLGSRFDLSQQEKFGKLVSLILESAHRAAELTSNLLAFSRKGKILSTPVVLQKVIGSALDIAERTIDKKVRLQSVLADEPLLSVGDPGQLQNAILNLLLNARDAMPWGGTITVGMSRTVLTQAWCDGSEFDVHPGEFAAITVSDTGTGISKEIREHMFEPFFTTKEEGKGTGLGLAAVYGTMNSHHGALTVQSEVGKGTSFTLYLPLAEANTRASVQSHVSETAHEGMGTVLLVEDEAVLQTTAKMLLEDLGYEVVCAGNGQKAVELYRQEHGRIDLVLLDIVMPEMGGIEALELMKTINPSARIILMSGFAQTQHLPAAAAGFIKKPYRKSELVELLRKQDL